jgi:hypothetical protein
VRIGRSVTERIAVGGAPQGVHDDHPVRAHDEAGVGAPLHPPARVAGDGVHTRGELADRERLETPGGTRQGPRRVGAEGDGGEERGEERGEDLVGSDGREPRGGTPRRRAARPDRTGQEKRTSAEAS